LEDLGLDRRIIIRTDLREIEWEDVDWILLAHDRNWWMGLLNTVKLNLRIPYKEGNFLTS
jgi:hypothetical protein